MNSLCILFLLSQFSYVIAPYFDVFCSRVLPNILGVYAERNIQVLSILYFQTLTVAVRNGKPKETEYI